MADFGTSEAVAAPQPAPQAGHLDDDLIDYDSDDVSVKNPDMQQASEPSETHTLDVGVTSSETKPVVRDASDSAKTTNDIGLLSETAGLDANTTPQEGNNSEDHAHAAQEVKTIADAGPTATSVAGSDVSIHEIDYDHDGLAYDANDGDKSEQLAVAAHDEHLSAAESSLPNVAGTENEIERYEIDWEDDEAANDNATPDATAQDATQRDAMDVNYVDFAVGDDAQGSTADGVDPASQDPTTHESMAAQATPESDVFPDITVVYKGEAYPMFAYTADGFFSNVSLIDETMKTVLDAFRAELERNNDLGPHDELVFQSSPPETLSMTTMRQILEILDILLKNEDFDSSRTLTTYLFTKPNAMKQFEFLVESATDKNKGLAQVIYYFRPPFYGGDYDGTNAMDGYDEQLDNLEGAGENIEGASDDVESAGDDIEGAGDDGAGHGDDEYTENHGSIEDEDAASEYDDDGYVDNHESDGSDEAAEYHDGGIDYSTGDKTTAANENDDRADDFGGPGAEPAANQEADLIDYIDDKIASNDGHGHVEHSASADTGAVSNHNDEEELIDYSDEKIADDYASAYPRISDRPGSAAHDDEDLIEYTDDKNSAADENDLIGYGSSVEANDDAEEGAQDPSQAHGENEGKGAEHHDATSGHDANHVEHGVDLVDYINSYTYTTAGNNVVSYDADDSDLIDYSSDKYAAGNDNVASHVEEGQVSAESVQEGVAQGEGTQADATGHDPNSAGEYQNSHLQVGTGHSRNASDISITFSAADADGVPAHAQSANNPVLGFGRDESADFDYSVLEGTQASAGQHPTEGGIATASTTESSTTATLSIDDGAAMNLNPPVGQDELSEIDWREDLVPTVGGSVTDAQFNAMKRAHPHEMDAQDGNDVKRRRS
ncbi:Uncharacterized protein TPAR_02664 [Tolypocladium paradoxum]|uniref:Uncharacterized protein n=1 Tax=Tolypocladium paradoxum TaxID=94208 RepID=A0A2S4L417_9HYPO|nr:Uncharacterized protein TPAR_02664 [Tolypocladium paradoxum]